MAEIYRRDEKKKKVKKKESEGFKATLKMVKTLKKLPPKEKVKVKDARKRSVKTPLYKKDAKVLSPSKKEKPKKEPKKAYHI